MTLRGTFACQAALLAGFAAVAVFPGGCSNKTQTAKRPPGEAVRAPARPLARRPPARRPPARRSPTNPMLTLPTSTSTTVGVQALEVQVRRDGLAVGAKVVTAVHNGKVSPTVKRDGPDGFLIDPLFKALRREVRRLKVAEKSGGVRFTGLLRLAVDVTTPYRLFAEVLYTASQAELREYQLVVRGPRGESVVHVESPRAPGRARGPGKPGKPPLHLTVVMTTKGFLLKSRFGSECPPYDSDKVRLCYATEGGKYTPAVFRKLQLQLWRLFAQKYRDDLFHATPEEKWAITFIADPTIRFGDVIHALDAMREIPGNATQPKVRHRVPLSGCAMRYDRAAGSWGFAEMGGGSVRELGCMYYRVIFALGAS